MLLVTESRWKQIKEKKTQTELSKQCSTTGTGNYVKFVISIGQPYGNESTDYNFYVFIFDVI